MEQTPTDKISPSNIPKKGGCTKSKQSATIKPKVAQEASTTKMKSGSVNDLLDNTLSAISKASPAQQLIVGSVSGWTTGYLTKKVGKPAAIVVGGSILLFQVAQQQKLVNSDWDKVKQKVQANTRKIDTSKVPLWKSSITKFARTNTYFAAGFVGGFLIGLAT